MSYFSEEEDNSEFRDIPDEVSGQSAEVPQVRQNRQQVPAPKAPPAQKLTEQEEQYYEDYQEDEQVEESEEDFTDVLSNARLRLEQGRLYEMIMNHDIFAGVDADEQAIKFVTKQMRNFAKMQMEIMLGMRQEETKVQALTAADFPFNDLEVQTLKALASAATKGVSSKPEAQVFSGTQAPARRQVGLNTISAPSRPAAKPGSIAPPRPAEKPRPPQPKQQVAQKPLPAKSQQPVKRQRLEADIEQILREEGITREEYERQYGGTPLTKPVHQMSESEIIERNKRVSAQKAVKSTIALPMPPPEQEEYMYAQRAMAAAENPQMKSIMNLLNTASATKK